MPSRLYHSQLAPTTQPSCAGRSRRADERKRNPPVPGADLAECAALFRPTFSDRAQHPRGRGAADRPHADDASGVARSPVNAAAWPRSCSRSAPGCSRRSMCSLDQMSLGHLKPIERRFENAYGLTAATCGSVKGSVRCTTPSAYNLSMAPSDRPSMRARMFVVSWPIDGAPRQMRPGVNDIFRTTP